MDFAKYYESAETRQYYKSLIVKALRRDCFSFRKAGGEGSYKENSILTISPSRGGVQGEQRGAGV